MRRCLIAFVCAALPAAAAVGVAQPRGPAGVEVGSLDRSADPCVDFYQFACGGWMAANPLPADRQQWGRPQEVRDRNDAILRRILERRSASGDLAKAIDYYAACLDTRAIDAKGLAPLRPDLRRIDHLRDTRALADLLAHLHTVAAANPPSGLAATSTFPFFQLVARSDPTRAIDQIAWARPDALGLPDREYYTGTDDRSVKLRAAYRNHVARMLELSGMTPAESARAADAVLRIETRLAMVLLDRAAVRDPNALTNPRTFAELQALTPHFDWKRYVQARRAPPFERLNVSQPTFLAEVDRVLADTRIGDIRSYLRWHLLHSAATMLPTVFGEAEFAFFSRALLGQQEPQPRWRLCLAQTDEHLGDALGKAFVEDAFRPAAKADILAMVGRLKAALREDIQRAAWMGDETRRAALQKLDAIENRIGYPDTWREYTSLQISRADAYGNLQRVRAAENGRDLSHIGHQTDLTDWLVTPPTVNAAYISNRNTILFPAGILQPPYYEAARDAAVNYGAAGAFIGHELTHGFDDSGRKFDANGNVRDWWTAADAKRFDERASCVASQYSEYVVAGDTHINGRLTLGENTADNGGLRLALMAYLAGPGPGATTAIDGLTPEQRVFVGYGQMYCATATPEYERAQTRTNSHAANRYRVNGVVSNMPEFQRAFACKADAPMVRANACRVW